MTSDFRFFGFIAAITWVLVFVLPRRFLLETRQQMAKEKIVTRFGEFAKSVIYTVREPLISLDQDLRVVTVSRSFYEFFQVKPEETVGQLIYDLGNKQWDIPKLRELLETILPEKTSFDNYEVEHDFATIGRRTMLLNGRQIEQVQGKEWIILLAIEDITERKQIEIQLLKAKEEWEHTFYAIADIITIQDKDMHIVRANKAAHDFSRQSRTGCHHRI